MRPGHPRPDDEGARAAPGPCVAPAAAMIELVDRAAAAAASVSRGELLRGSKHNVPLRHQAPELTGRTAHTVDGRADLYALGAMFYEWATGSPPFEESDPLALLRLQLSATPQAPAALCPGLPKTFSDIILRLLEKEPGRRYQSCEALEHDLRRLLGDMRSGRPGDFELGERDFPSRLSPPKEVGRDGEIERLRDAVDAAARGEFRAVLVSGAPGVGKTALLNNLRSIVGARNGRFISGKFDQYSRAESPAVFEAIRSLGRLLLAEREQDPAEQRARILGSLGPQAGLLAAVPELRLLLGELPAICVPDPVHALARTSAAVTNLLRAVASPQRPLVMMLDDLQWSGSMAIRFISAMVDAMDLPGVVFVAAFRNDELAHSHPLQLALPRWLASRNAELIRLGNLAQDRLAEMLGQMLHLSATHARQLAQRVEAYTGGNPYDTVEFINALRQDGVIAWRDGRWQWDEGALGAYGGGSDVVMLVSSSIARLPAAARSLLDTLSCIQHEASPELVSAASGLPVDDLAAPFEVLHREGLVSRKPGPPETWELGHDRVQQAAYTSMTPSRRGLLHLDLARRLAGNGGMESAAADQYIAAAAWVTEAAEARRAATLLRDAASSARRMANFNASQRMLEAALAFLGDPAGVDVHGWHLRLACEIDLHATLCATGLLDEADEVYSRIEGCAPDALTMAAPACAQMDILTKRGKSSQCVAIGLQCLRRLGIDVPDHFDNDAGLEEASVHYRKWVQRFDPARELSRPDCTDVRVVAVARLVVRMGIAAYYFGGGLASWLALESCTLWRSHGPCPELSVAICRISSLSSVSRDYRTGYLCGRQMAGFCQARGWDFEYAQCAYIFESTGAAWFEPLETTLRRMPGLRDALLAAGDHQFACMTYVTTCAASLDCADSLEDAEQELEAAFDLASRTGHAQMAGIATGARRLVKALKGDTRAEGSFEDDEFRENDFLARMMSVNRVHFEYFARRVVAAAIFGEQRELAPLAARAAALNRLSPGLDSTPNYLVAWVRWLGVVGAAWQLRRDAAAPDAAERAAIGETLDWLRLRAGDAPMNFRHIHFHASAEYAWACGDIEAAGSLFAQALCAAEEAHRPWHRALITESSARFESAHGRATTGRALLFEALRVYDAWGAWAKSGQLRRELGVALPPVPSHPPGRHKPSTDVDTLAVLRAAQVLGSERDTARLRARVGEVLSSVTGARRVTVAVWDSAAAEWLVDDPVRGRLPAPQAAHALPLSAVRYVERTGEPLLLADALADDRFSGDPYFKDAAQCSLMVVPIHRKGTALAMLVLENRAGRGAFGPAVLDAVAVIAGQLAVSLENALLYESLEQKVSEQTQQLRDAQSNLLAEARRAGMSQVATNVLHNVGNVLTSVNVSARVLADLVRGSHASRLGDLARLLAGKTAQQLASYIAEDPRGRMIPGYVDDLDKALSHERAELLAELDRLRGSIEHINNVVAMQQGYAGRSGVLESTHLTDLVDDALRLQEDALLQSGVRASRNYARVRPAQLDKTRVMQILINLLENARHAVQSRPAEREIAVRVRESGRALSVSVTDNGCGIAQDDLAKIFSHGFTTKPDGHGFGLHSCAIAAREMGGSLEVHSDGPGRGATFTLILGAGAAPG